MLTLARHAMATRFELVLHGKDEVALRAAGEEALDEIDRLEGQLSLYRSSSEIAHVNARAAREAVRVTPPVFALLQHAFRLTEETSGAFDITVAPLVRAWGFMAGSGCLPDPASLAEARAHVGMQNVRLYAEDFTVRFAREGVMLDLGAIGKGYAIERAAEILREAGVTSALIHGGTSTVKAIGSPPDADSWAVAIAHPLRRDGAELATVRLRDEAMSVSAISGKSFDSAGKTFGHVLDPRTGEPVQGAILATVALPSATETDALSTALLTLGKAGHQAIAGLRPGMRTLVALPARPGELEVETNGIVLGRRTITYKFPEETGG
jgi:thiamine biosynthesis lipoprotein